MLDQTFETLLNRSKDSHKYDFGHVLVIGGSLGMVGAPLLAASSALRSGAGLVSIATSNEVLNQIEGLRPELMSLKLSEEHSLALKDLDKYINEKKVSVIVYGPGHKPETNPTLLEQLVKYQNLQLVVDGGGLIELSKHQEILKDLTRDLIITPHIGEFSHFFDRALPSERSEQILLAKQFTLDNQLILVLKGNRTIVVEDGNVKYENASGGPGLATAGSGDVLSGIIGSILAQKIKPVAAAAAAVYLHGKAGDIAATNMSQPGMIASDIIDALPAAYLSQV
jgi:hydroxyethylthiazole kinase-like uncharacterized protein yjeF